MERENEMPAPAETGLPAALCPHCKTPLSAVGWLSNMEVGLLTFFHNVPECMVALNCQLIPIERRVQPALPQNQVKLS